jgi:hypothetical protein
MSTPWVFDLHSETHDVDLIKKASAWRAVPDLGRTPVAAPTGRWWVHPVRDDPAPVEMAGLAELPDPGVARAAVPDAGARPYTTRPSQPGAHATIRWSLSSTAGDHRTVAALLPGRARTQVREARRASRNAPTPSVVAQPSHRRTAARNARRPTRVPMVTPRAPRTDRARESPTGQREGTRKSRQPRQLALPEAAGELYQYEQSVHSRRSTGLDERPARLTRRVLGHLDPERVEQRACQRDDLVGADSRTAQ